MEKVLVILKSNKNKFGVDDQRLINFGLRCAEMVDVLAINCNVVGMGGLRNVDKFFMLASNLPIIS